MPFTLVIFSTYELSQEPLAITKLAPPFFMSKKDVVLNVVSLKYEALSKIKNIFLLKELFFTSPQLKITLFKTVLLQLTLLACFLDTRIVNKISLFIKRKSNASTS